MLKRFVFFIISVVLLLGSFSALAGSVALSGIRIWNDAAHSRIVFDLTGRVYYKTETLKNPQRLVIDLRNTRWAVKSTPSFKHSPIKVLRHSTLKDGSLRVVLEFNQTVTTKDTMLSGQGAVVRRLAIDMQSSSSRAANILTGKAGATAHSLMPSTQVKVPHYRPVIIAIDAGHGGRDSGARGYYGTYEKTVTLAISKDLANLINKQHGMKAVLTRKGDYYITLRGRTRIARKNKADLFIAIHADAYRNSSAHGISVFALSERGTTSEAARWLVKQEHSTELGDVELHGKSHALKSMLIDLSQTATNQASVLLGKSMLKPLSRVGRMHGNHVELAGFMVLKSPDIPSILIETGFLSNPGEERKLRTRAYQQKLAQAILQGLKTYLAQRPPSGTHYAAHTKPYIVKRGDTLSSIAEKNGVTVKQLKRLNGLHSSVILLGQRLRIPI